MALTPDEISLIQRLKQNLDAQSFSDSLLLRYYLGKQQVEQLGMAIPPTMRKFLVIANWPRVLVDTIERRQNVRSLVLPGAESDDERLRAIWDGNNMDADLSLFNLDRMIYGRAFLSVGTNEEDAEIPLIHVESPREMTAIIDQRMRRIDAACRFYGTDMPDGPATGTGPTNITLYLPNQTIWVVKDGDRWIEADRDKHNLGKVPVVMHLNRRRSGSWLGESEMSDIIPFTDAAARSLTNLQFAQEAHGIPQKWVVGVSKQDFVDATGNALPKWMAYYDQIWMNQNKDAKIGQFTPADLKNFETAVDIYGRQAAVATGFPARYFGLFTVNPPAEGAIRADEAQLVESVQRQNRLVGTTVGWAAALAYRFATGEWTTGNQIRVDWFDPGTPTYSQRADAITKLMSGPVPILSREGAWDELGWSEQRKAKERAYFDTQEASTPAPEPVAAPVQLPDAPAQ